MGNQPKQVKPSEQFQSQEIKQADLQAYINFTKQKKTKYIQDQNKLITPQILNIGAQVIISYLALLLQSWINQAIQILEKFKNQHQFRQNRLIDKLQNYLQEQDSSGFIQAFSNKYYLEYISQLDIQQFHQEHQSASINVDFANINKVMNQYRTQYSSIQQDYQIQDKDDIELNGQIRFEEQMQQIRRYRQKKQFQQKLLFVEREITRQDHLIMLIVNKFQDKLQQDFQEILEDALEKLKLNQSKESMKLIENPKIQIIEDLGFIINYLSELIYNLYDNIFSAQEEYSKIKQYLNELAIKCVFKNPILYETVFDIIKIESTDDISKMEEIFKNKKDIRIADLEIDKEFENIEFESVDIKMALDKILKSSCIYYKFQQISEIRNIICKMINSDLLMKSYQQSSTKQQSFSSQLVSAKKSVDLDSFIKILVYVLIKYGKSDVLINMRIIDAFLPKEINYQSGDDSATWLALLTAINYVLNDSSNIEDIKKDVLDQQIHSKNQQRMNQFKLEL